MLCAVQWFPSIPAPVRGSGVVMQAAAADASALDDLQVIIDNDSDTECTVITVEGKDQPHLLMTLSGAFTAAGFTVVSASITNDEGRVLDVFRVQTGKNKKVSIGAKTEHTTYMFLVQATMARSKSSAFWRHSFLQSGPRNYSIADA